MPVKVRTTAKVKVKAKLKPKVEKEAKVEIPKQKQVDQQKQEARKEHEAQQSKIVALEAKVREMSLEKNEFKQAAFKLQEKVEDLELDKEELDDEVLNLQQEVRSEKVIGDLEKVRLEFVKSSMKTGLLTIEGAVLLADAVKSDKLMSELNHKQLEGGFKATVEYFLLEYASSQDQLFESSKSVSEDGDIETIVTGESEFKSYEGGE